MLNLLITTDDAFCQGVKSYVKGIMKESILISSVNAKERNRFFNKILHSIDEFKCRVD
ncbi:MAG: hypothetical protein KAT38_02330 [Bacteroidales bacterium]|nr:hypothetical protein [Bacteroidales bacterium]